MNNEIMVVKGIQCYEQNGVAYLNLEEVARGLGIIKADWKAGVRYERIHKQNLSKWLCEFGLLKSEKETLPRFIPENIFYRLSMKAKNAAAEKFQAWVADEVIPAIRRTGGYIAGEENMTDEELVARAFLVVHKKLEESQKIIADLNATLEEQRPKVVFADTVQKSEENLLIRDFVKFLSGSKTSIGERGLFALLRDKQILMTGDWMNKRKHNVPYQQYINSGYFVVKETCGEDKNGKVHVNSTTLVTPKGQMWIANHLEEWMAA